MAKTALLLIDVVNEFDFPNAAALLKTALPAARRIAALAERARRARVPVIYANDNYGRWRSDFKATLERCLRPDSKGREIVSLLVPRPKDYFVLKPMHSAFFGSPLELLLKGLRVKRLILCGFACDSCVHATAVDAYMRGFELSVPSDCTAAEAPAFTRAALLQMREKLGADVGGSARVRLR